MMMVGPILGEVEQRLRAIGVPLHEVDQLLIDDVDDLLARIERAQHLLAERLLLDALDEFVGDVEIDVGFEQGGADLLQAILDVGFGDAALAAHVFHGIRDAADDAFEHVVIP